MRLGIIRLDRQRLVECVECLCEFAVQDGVLAGFVVLSGRRRRGVFAVTC